MPTNKEIAQLLKETASLIHLTGGNEFRARAFSSAARTVELLDEPAEELVKSGALQSLQGIGPKLAGQITEILEHGTFRLREDLLHSIPPGLDELLRIKGLGARKVRSIWQTLGITTIEELEEAAAVGRLAKLDGFGAKTQENVLKNIQLLKQYGTRRRSDQARAEASKILDAVRSIGSVERADLAGALRRKVETVDEIVVVAASSEIDAVCDELAAQWSDVETLGEGRRRLRGLLPDGLGLTIHVVLPDLYGTELWTMTGSTAHVSAFEGRFSTAPAAASEAAIYERAGIPFIAPELRENDGELEAALRGELPELVTDRDLKGILHNHSTYSDGAHTLRQMTEAARSMGFTYYAACDHSRSLSIAGGLSIERVREQQEEIRHLNEEYGEDFHIFSGTESDILTDGSLDYPDDVLAGFDLVVASIHSSFNMTAKEATDRLVRAIENPYTTILGHPTGRKLLRREGYPVDYERIIDACAANQVVIELNANPRRLDLDWRWIRSATDRGVLISINPDAHSIDELRYIWLGTEVARKGWLTAEQCLNAKSLSSFRAWIEERRSRRIGSLA